MRGIWRSALFGASLIAFGCGCQAAFAPTVRVTCPPRTTAAPDCELRWLVAFDMLPVRQTPLPALQPVGEIVPTSSSRRGNTATLYLDTKAGRVRTIMWGDHLSLQRDLRDPLRSYLDSPDAPAIDLTMRASLWVDPGGTADNRMVRYTHPLWWIANTLVGIGLLYWLSLPVQMATLIGGRNRSSAS